MSPDPIIKLTFDSLDPGTLKEQVDKLTGKPEVKGTPQIVADPIFSRVLALSNKTDALDLGELAAQFVDDNDHVKAMTLAAWVKPDVVDTQRFFILSAGKDWVLWAGNGIGLLGPGVNCKAEKIPTVSSNQWMHIVVVYDQQYMTTYVNGSLVQQTDCNNKLIWSADSKLLIGGTSEFWHLIDTKSGFIGRVDRYNPSGNQYVQVVSGEPTFQIIEVGTGEVVLPFTIPGGSNFLWAAFSPDGTQVVTVSLDNTVTIWDATTSKIIKAFLGGQVALNKAAFSPDKTQVVTTNADQTAKIWDAVTGNMIQTLIGHKDTVNSATFSPDGTQVVTTSADKTAKIWDAVTGNVIQTLTFEERVSFAEFDGPRLLTQSEETFKIWQLIPSLTGQVACVEVYKDALTKKDIQADIKASLSHNTAPLIDLALNQPQMDEITIKNLSPLSGLTGDATISNIINNRTGLLLDLKMDHFEEKNGKKYIPDTSNKHYKGEIEGTPKIEADEYLGHCLVFDGPDDYLKLPSMNADYSQGLTIMAWVYYDQIQQGVCACIIDLGNGEGHDNIFLEVKGPDKFYAGVYAGTRPDADKRVLVPDALEPRCWMHLALTIDAQGYAIPYKDGHPLLEESKKMQLNRPQNVQRDSNFIGRSNWDNEGFAGKMAHLRHYNRVLSADEIRTNIEFTLLGDTPQSVLDDTFGRAIQFKGTKDVVNLGDQAKWFTNGDNMAQPFVIEAWVNPDTFPSHLNWATLLSVGEKDGPFWALRVGSQTGFIWSDSSGKTWQSLTADAPIHPGEWSHLAVIYDNKKNLSLYVNGNLQQTLEDKALGDIPWSDTAVCLGANPLLPIAINKDQVQPLVTLVGHTEKVNSAAFSPDGKQIVTANFADKGSMVWDATERDPVQSERGPLFTLPGSFNSAAFSPDGTRIVTSSWDNYIRVWDATKSDQKKPLFTLWAHSGAVFSAVFSPDGTRIVTTGDDGKAKVWDATKSDQKKPLFTLSGYFNSAVFSPDGTRIVTAGNDDKAKVWDATKRDPVQSEREPLFTLPGPFNSAVFSPDGTRIVTASEDGTTMVWGATKSDQKKPLFTLLGHTKAVNSALFSPDGTRIVTANEDGKAMVWDATKSDQKKPLVTLLGHTKAVNSAVFSPDGTRIVTASQDGKAMVWDVQSLFATPFAGRVAHLRLYAGTPMQDAQQVQRRLEKDILKTATGTIFPLEFSLHNSQMQQVIFLGDVPKTLALDITNSGRKNIILPQGNGSGNDLAQMELRFRPGTLADPDKVTLALPPSDDAPGDSWAKQIQAGVNLHDDTANWHLEYGPQEPDGTDVFHLTKVKGNSATYTLAPGETRTLRLGNIQADQRGGSRATRVLLRYRLQYDDHHPLEGSRLHYMAIVQLEESEIQARLDELNTQSENLHRTAATLQQDTGKLFNQSDTLSKIIGSPEEGSKPISDRVKMLESAHGVDEDLLHKLDERLKNLDNQEDTLDSRVDLLEKQISHQQKPQLSAGTIGPALILCNGATDNTLTLFLQNVSKEDLDLIPAQQADKSTITLRLYPERPWGLCDKEKDFNSIIVPPPSSDWNVSKDEEKGSINLEFTGEADAAKIPAGKFIEIKLENVKCSKPPGTAYLTVSFKNIGKTGTQKQDDQEIPIYASGELPVAVERSPIILTNKISDQDQKVKNKDGKLESVTTNRNHSLVSGELKLINNPKLQLRFETDPLDGEGEGSIALSPAGNTYDLRIASKGDLRVGRLIDDGKWKDGGKLHVGEMNVTGKITAAQNITAGSLTVDGLIEAGRTKINSAGSSDPDVTTNSLKAEIITTPIINLGNDTTYLKRNGNKLTLCANTGQIELSKDNVTVSNRLNAKGGIDTDEATVEKLQIGGGTAISKVYAGAFHTDGKTIYYLPSEWKIERLGQGYCRLIPPKDLLKNPICFASIYGGRGWSDVDNWVAVCYQDNYFKFTAFSPVAYDSDNYVDKFYQEDSRIGFLIIDIG